MAVSITDVIAYRRLVAAGNDELWYEDLNVAAGTMVELAAANGDIDTSDQLIMFEGYQKVFVVNGANLKIADFVNTKLTITAPTTAPTRGSTVTQATSNATMVVDFVNTAKTEIYGKTTSGTFVTTDGYTLSGGGMDPADRVPSAVAEATTTPHWYDWTVYPDGASGSMPAKAYLGCLYQGRPMLAGHPDYPYQWYMPRQADHTDWAYVANDAQSPVAGNDADAGEIGDIIRCLIPYKDDFVVMGCATTIWVLAGNPAEGGTIQEVDLTEGIFGADSWCFDGDNNLYFWGTSGIGRVARDFKSTINLTEISLPALIDDEAADPSTHRITMEYDRKRHGLLICITLLADGTNSNYFFSLNEATIGLYPESYPEECGTYSLFYYDSNDKTYRDLLIGCKDGYIRKFDNTAEDDDAGGSDDAISSHVALGPFELGPGGHEGSIESIEAFITGGDPGGTETDSDDIAFKLFTGRSAGAVAEAVDANSGEKVSGTFQATGRPRGRRKRQRVRGAFAGIRLANTTAGEKISFDRLIVNTTKKGRLK